MKLKIPILICVVLCFNTKLVLCKNYSLDSLLALTKTANSSQEYIDQLNLLSQLYSQKRGSNQKDSSKFYSFKAVEFARKIGYKAGLAEALYDIGKHYVGVESKPAEATLYLLESLDLFTQLQDDDGISKCYMQLGLISYILKNYEAAVKNLRQSLKSNNQSTSKFLIALSYTELDSFKQAKEYFFLAIEDYNRKNSLQRLGECYLWLGRLHLKTNNLDSAFFYLNKTINGKTTSDNPYALQRPYAFLADAYLQSNQLDKAIIYSEKSFQLERNKTTEGKDEISLIQATKVLSKAYQKKGNYKQAFFYLELYNSESSRFTSGSIKQKVADMQSLFDFEKKIEIQKAQQKNIEQIAQQQLAKERILRNAFLVGAALLLLLLIVLFNRFNLKKRANNELQKLNDTISHEKKRSDDLLLNILPEEIARELMENGEAGARDYQHVSILFTDFKEFTQLSEKVTAQELVAEINHCFKAFDNICEKYKIEKIKTIGDSYMAAGGLPAPFDGSTKNTVLAALEMSKFVVERKRERELEGKLAFEMRSGIHTGNVVAGIVGVKKFQYDIWGDTVNTASRMESHGDINKVNISQFTYQILKSEPELQFENRGKITTKGKGDIKMYFVSKQD